MSHFKHKSIEISNAFRQALGWLLIESYIVMFEDTSMFPLYPVNEKVPVDVEVKPAEVSPEAKWSLCWVYLKKLTNLLLHVSKLWPLNLVVLYWIHWKEKMDGSTMWIYADRLSNMAVHSLSVVDHQVSSVYEYQEYIYPNKIVVRID